MNTEIFFKKYQIHDSYKEFFNQKRIFDIENFFDTQIAFTPDKKKVFKALNGNLYKSKILILGQDPYFQLNVATGRSFEVNNATWNSNNLNASLRNILKLIYKSYTGNYKNIEEIRSEIDSHKFNIMEQNEIFDNWQNQGVIFLNVALTTKLGKPGAHIKFWSPIIIDLINFILLKRTNIICFAWGNKVQKILCKINFEYLYESNHPAICGNLNNEKDFMFNKCFLETKNLINWLGK